jgi:dipeptidase E
MQMILASKEKFLLDKGYDLLGVPRKDLKIGLITTAFKVSEDKGFIQYIEEYYDLMRANNIDFKQFDIEGKTEEEILDFFSDRNIVQIIGGNVFYLLKIIRATKFDLILKKLLERGIPYIGCSGGAYIMCPTIEVGSWKAARNRYGLEDFTALNYVPFLIKCHFSDDQKEKIAEKAKTLQYPLRILKDDQCFYIKNGEMEFIGGDKEVV